MKPRHPSITRLSTSNDEWVTSGPNILSEANKAKIRKALDRSCIIVQHRLYRGGSSPSRVVFDDYGDYEAYTSEHARAGDTIDIWIWEDVCRDESKAAFGKCPDDDGYVPTKGAY